jgi:hypothetical protein
MNERQRAAKNATQGKPMQGKSTTTMSMKAGNESKMLGPHAGSLMQNKMQNQKKTKHTTNRHLITNEKT